MCHSGDRPQAGLSLARLTERMATADVGEQADTWQKVAEMLETRQMPPAPMPSGSRATRSAPRRCPGSGRRSTTTTRARRRSGTRHGPAADERRIRLRDPRPHRRRRQGRRRRLERLGRRRGLRQLRRRPVRAGRQRRALPRGGEAGRRPRGHRLGPAGLLHRSRQDRPRAVGAQPDQRALRVERVPRRLGRRRPPVRLRSLRARRSTSRGTTSTAPRSAIRPRRLRGLAAKEGITGRFAEHIWDGGQPAGRRLSERAT